MLSKISIIVFLASFLFPQIVSAGTAISYDGTGIWSWRSISDWSQGAGEKNYKVNHSQTTDRQGQNKTMKVTIHKYNFIGSTAISTGAFTGTTSGDFTARLGEGKYFLRFEAPRSTLFDIKGSVTY